MTFPTIQTADTQSGTVTTNSTSWTLTYPTNLSSGDLILGFAGVDGAGVFAGTGDVTTGNGWLMGQASTAPVTLNIFAKISGGTETGTFSLNINASEQGGWRVFRITGWEGGLTSGSASLSGAALERTGIGFSLLASGASTTPNPGSFNPANWNIEDTLWFAAMAADTSRTVSVYPLAGNNTADVSGGSNGATLGLCTTTSAVASLDPSTFTISASDDWVAVTVAVRPAVDIPRVPRFTPYPQILAH